MNPRIKNPLILSIVSTVFLIPVLVLTQYLFSDGIQWLMLVVTVLIYFVVIFIVFLTYGNIGRK